MPTRLNPLTRPCRMALCRHAARCALWLVLATLGAAVCGALPAWAQAPVAGTELVNRARVTYTDPGSGAPITLDSNTVRVFVQPLESFTLTQDNAVRAPAAAAVSLAHRLTNTGNTTSSFVLRVANQAGDDFDLSGLTLIHDVNANGQPDAGEPQFVAGASVTLAPAQAMDFVVTGNVPTSITDGQTARVGLTATTVLQSVTATNTDTILTATGVATQVRNTASVQSARPNEQITFSPVATNLGNASPVGMPITVDGVTRTLVMLRSAIPANTTFAGLIDPGFGTPLYHVVRDPLHAYRSTPPANLATVDAVAYGVAAYPLQMVLTFGFRVRVNGNASGDIVNTAHLFFTDPTTSQTQNSPSNPVVVRVPVIPPIIQYFTDGTFTRVTHSSTVGRPLFVQASAAQCNVDSAVAETQTISISSQLTGDIETFGAVETSANSGIFRILPSVPTRDGAINPVERENGIVETVKRDILTARMECSAIEAVAPILIDPFGIVFDSRTNDPVAGARVTLVDAATGAPAQVFQFDGVTPAPSTVTTGADGAFSFPLVPSGTYRLVVVPPGSSGFPSQLPPGLLPPGRVIDPVGSYGGTFPVTAETGTVRIDVPVDTPISGLFVEKTSSKRVAEIAEFVDYQVRFRNNTGIPLTNVMLNDDLPPGFSYQAGTARLVTASGAVPFPNAGAVPGGRLSFPLGNIAIGQDILVAYRVRIGPGTRFGDNVNRAQASGTTPFGTSNSNVASVRVRVQGGVLNDKGIIFGKVFVDVNHNGIQNRDELGIPGVRVYVEDGTFAITDSEGKYSIYGLRSGTRVVKVDTTTLPFGSVLSPLTNRHGMDAKSSFVDLKKGEFHKVNFAEGSATAAILAEVKTLRKVSSEFIAETEKGITTPLLTGTEEQNYQTVDPTSRPSSGIIGSGLGGRSFSGSELGQGIIGGGETSLPDFNQRLPRHGSAAPLPPMTSGLPVPPVQAALPNFETLLPNLTNDLGFVDLKDNETLPGDQYNVRVKGAFGSTFKLAVNGQEISNKSVGTKSSLEGRQILAWEYIGVRFKPGQNTLEVTQTDAYGNERGTQRITVIAPGRLGTLRVSVPARPQPADGVTPVLVKVELVDDKGTAVSARTPITLEASNGLWQVKDLNEAEPGVQVFIEGGRAEYQLLPPLEAGEALVRVSSGILEGNASISFVPELRPLIGVGVIEGKINLFRFKAKSARAVRSSNFFEEDLQSLFKNGNGEARAGARAAMFWKGRVQGKYLLTMRYDSSQQTEDRLFRDIQPDQFYPVYGDSSIKGFEAQSTSPLYVRVDKERSYLLYGDYTTNGDYSTQGFSSGRNLGDYVRSLTGLKGHHETGKFSTNFFLSHDNARQVIDQIRALGTSGPYQLRATPFIPNSEKVEIIVRDREQPSVVLSTTPQSRFTDYQIDGLTEGILFRRPIPSFDANLNPVFIRVTYEIDQGGPKFFVMGVDGQYKLSDRFGIGTTWAKDRNPQDPFDLFSANATYRFGSNTWLTGEWAQSDRLSVGKGSAQRVELLHEGQRILAKAFWGQSDAAFDNPGSILSRGREEANAKLSYLVSDRTRLIGELIRTSDVTFGGTRTGAQVGVEHSLGSNVRLDLGVRHARESEVPQLGGAPREPINFTSIRARLSGQVPRHPQAGGYVEYEQDIKDSDKKVLALGAEYLLSSRSRLYARYELISTLIGRYALYDNQSQHTTLIGIDTDYMNNGHLFSEYRIRDAISGREAEAALGLRNLWNLGKGIRLHTTFERIKGLGAPSANPVLGATANEATAVTAALEYTRSARWKGTTRLELRRASSTDSLLHTLGIAYKLSDDWTALARSIVSVSQGRGTGIGGGIEDRLQLGVAYRQTATDKWSALAKYEYRYDKDDAGTSIGQLFTQSIRRKVHLMWADVNYQPARRLVASGHYAAKFVTDDSNGLSSDTSAQLLAARLTYDWTRRSDISLIASTLFGRSFGERQYGLGLELGYLLSRNMWLSMGYNLVGFRDPDFAEDSDTQRGPYLRIRYKFDEDLFGRRHSIVERLVANAATTAKEKPEVATAPIQSVPVPLQPVAPSALVMETPVPTPQPPAPAPTPQPVEDAPQSVQPTPAPVEVPAAAPAIETPAPVAQPVTPEPVAPQVIASVPAAPAPAAPLVALPPASAHLTPPPVQPAVRASQPAELPRFTFRLNPQTASDPQAVLAEVAALLRAHPEARAEIIEFRATPQPGKSGLGQTRAEAVRKSLVAAGVAANRLQVRAVAQPGPQAMGNTAQVHMTEGGEQLVCISPRVCIKLMMQPEVGIAPGKPAATVKTTKAQVKSVHETARRSKARKPDRDKDVVDK